MLRPLGIVTLLVGALGGALVAILHPDFVPWRSYLPCLVIGATGVALIHVGGRRAATDATALAGQMDDVRESAEELASLTAELAKGFAPDATVYDLPHELDARLQAPLNRFVAAREAIARVHGVQAYADVMGDFAAGERYLNRVWSAAAEGYVDEAQTYLEKAARQMARTRDALRLKKTA
jgi:hypothetical protein